MVKAKNNIPEEENEKLDDNAFKRAQEDARDGKASTESDKKKKKANPSQKAKDELFRGNQSEREWSSESDEYRRKS
ncbi:hypothetical protein [Pleomorphovibrio marinus]|uniref:hypothetical protein n=1 Tax=Pleomorphovibrio marinus TaxID=2164132 RepID=UPI000E0A89E5|nr:hypothetical protein [Pleomorphovibrio marinus]